MSFRSTLTWDKFISLKKDITRDDFMQLQEMFPTPLQASKLAIDDWKKTFDIDFFAPCVRCLWCAISVAHEELSSDPACSVREMKAYIKSILCLSLETRTTSVGFCEAFRDGNTSFNDRADS
jgi:hypothetical protein